MKTKYSKNSVCFNYFSFSQSFTCSLTYVFTSVTRLISLQSMHTEDAHLAIVLNNELNCNMTTKLQYDHDRLQNGFSLFLFFFPSFF